MIGRERIVRALVVFAAVGSLACSDRATEPSFATRGASARDVTPADVVTPQLIRQLAAARAVVPLPPAPHVRPALARLGQALAFDKILSGNHDISV
jgi:hypothetical protein